MPVGVVISRENVWLLQTPSPDIHQEVWGVVCLAALSAANTGRKYAWKLSVEKAGPRQQTIEEALGHRGPPPRPAARAGRVAALQFWALLQDFAVLHKWPYKWPAGKTLPLDHAFLGRDPAVLPRLGMGGESIFAIKVMPPP